MIYQVLAILFLAFFYAVYLGKMILQKKQGIKTDQIATKNKKDKVYVITEKPVLLSGEMLTG